MVITMVMEAMYTCGWSFVFNKVTHTSLQSIGYSQATYGAVSKPDSLQPDFMCKYSVEPNSLPRHRVKSTSYCVLLYSG